MKIAEQLIEFSKQAWILTNQRAMYWPAQNALVLSDLHLGKAAYFRKNGIPLPMQVSLKDINRLDFLIDHYIPEKVIIVGDLVHAGFNRELELFIELTAKYPATKFILIKGNHDRFSDKQLMDLGIDEIHNELLIHEILFTHQQPHDFEFHAVSGHIHPGVSVQWATQRMRFPCYIVGEKMIILPAFSTFTGLDTSSIPQKHSCYAFYEGGIFEVK